MRTWLHDKSWNFISCFHLSILGVISKSRLLVLNVILLLGNTIKKSNHLLVLVPSNYFCTFFMSEQ